MSKKITVFNLETGKSVDVCGVDAREYIKSGGWSENPEDVKEKSSGLLLPDGVELLDADACKEYVKELFERDLSKVTLPDLRIYCAEKFEMDPPAGAKKNEIISYIKSRNGE